MSTRHPRGYFACLLVAIVLVSALVDSARPSEGRVSGTVVEYRSGEWISVANQTTDPEGIAIALGDATFYTSQEHASAEPVVIKPGTRVTVWYRFVYERRPVADTVHVLPE
jgi:hypothetical protein